MDELILVIEILHAKADKQNDARDHDEYHAAGAVLALMGGAELTQKDLEYIKRWIINLP